MRKFDLWSLDLVENNIPVLHSLSPERWQNFTWSSIIPLRNIFVQKHQNKVILAISLIISRTWVVLKASVASMTSKDMIKSLASMTSTASLVSKSQKLLSGWFPCHLEPQQPHWPQQPQWPQWPQWPQQPHFIKKLTEDDVANNLATKCPILVSQCGMDYKKYTI